jgi:1,4-dihydroxy-2-naphthoate octaprenyltransferase
VNRWVAGARPRTLPAALVPVLVGTACAHGNAPIIWWRAGAALVVALALQIATNYANDYSDGVRGTDAGRVGPVRLVASGLAAPSSVKLAAFAMFGVAGVAGTALALAVGPEVFVVGAAAMLAGWFYTGGPKPYGYYGLGEVFVFVFFGVVATAGTTYVLLEQVTLLSVAASIAVGLLSCALLVVNNLRDIPTDTAAGKRTLAVRMGDGATRSLYLTLVAGAYLVIVLCAIRRPAAVAGLAGLVVAAGPMQLVRRGARGAELVAVLMATGKAQLITGILFAGGLWFGAPS